MIKILTHLTIMLDVNYIDDQALTDILEAKDLTESQAGYGEVAKMSVRDAFDAYLSWNGFIGHTDEFIRVYESLKEAEANYKAGPPKDNDWHNPENVPESALEEGSRFLLKKEREYFKSLDPTKDHAYVDSIWIYFGNLKWDKMGWFGNSPDKTYCVPIEFRIKELGDY